MEQILIVEDDSFLNKMLDYNLTADGYGVTSALNARTAAEAIRQREFDLVLLDINLPDGNGFELCRLIKPQHPDTIIIFLTANDQESDQIRGYEVGAPNASPERRSAPGQEGRWIKVSWGVDTLDSYPTSLEVICKDRRNLLLDISAALSTTNTSVSALNSRSTEDNFAMIHMEVKVRDNAHLLSVMNKLNQISGVLKVNRPAG